MPSATSADARARKLASWLAANGVRTSNLRFAPSPDGQVAVYATRRLEADETVGWIPKQCILSPINSRVGELLREHEISHGLALTAAVLFERASATSRWRDYFDYFMPKDKASGASLPMCWKFDATTAGYRAATRAIEATAMLGSRFRADFRGMQDDYESLKLAGVLDEMQRMLCAEGKMRPKAVREALSLKAFVAAASFVASRSFPADSSKHGLSLVPLADAFNHATDAEHIHVEGDDESDEENDEDNDDEDRSSKRPRRSSDASAPSLPSAPSDYLGIRTVRCADRNSELYNTYGEQTFATLLYKYGFVETSRDDVRFASIPREIHDRWLPCERKAANHLLERVSVGTRHDILPLRWQAAFDDGDDAATAADVVVLAVESSTDTRGVAVLLGLMDENDIDNEEKDSDSENDTDNDSDSDSEECPTLVPLRVDASDDSDSEDGAYCGEDEDGDDVFHFGLSRSSDFAFDTRMLRALHVANDIVVRDAPPRLAAERWCAVRDTASLTKNYDVLNRYRRVLSTQYQRLANLGLKSGCDSSPLGLAHHLISYEREWLYAAREAVDERLQEISVL